MWTPKSSSVGAIHCDSLLVILCLWQLAHDDLLVTVYLGTRVVFVAQPYSTVHPFLTTN